MNNSKALSLCGSRQASSRQGIMGMSNPEIAAFIKREAPEALQKEFKRVAKDRKSYCKFLTKFRAGRRELRLSQFAKNEQPRNINTPPSPPRPAPAKKSKTPPKVKFQLMNELGEVSNGNNRGGTGSNSSAKEINYANSGGSPNNANRRRRANFRANRNALKRAEADPFRKGMVLTGKTKAAIEKKMRLLARAGGVRANASREEVIRNLMVATPKAMAKKARALPKAKASSSSANSSANRKAAAFALAGRVKNKAAAVKRRRKFNKKRRAAIMKMAKGNARTHTKVARRPVRVTKEPRSRRNVNNAWAHANKLMSNFERAGLLNSANNKGQERVKLMEQYLLTKPPMRTPSPKKPAGNVIGGNINVAGEHRRLKAMKERSKSKGQKQRQRILKAMLNMREKAKPKVFKATRLVPNLGSPSNSGNNSGVEAKKAVKVSNEMSINALQAKVNEGKANSAEKRKLNVMKQVMRNLRGSGNSSPKEQTRPRMRR